VFFFITGRKMLPRAREEQRADPGWIKILLQAHGDGQGIETEWKSATHFLLLLTFDTETTGGNTRGVFF
jgi:hypothetical protein